MKNFRRKLFGARSLLTTLFLSLSIAIFAQTKTVTGIVSDENGESIIGATVSVKGTTTGTMTDLDGKFSISVKNNDVLTISYVGYAEQSVSVSGKNDLKVVMKEDAHKLDEFVVIGYGTVKKANVVGSIARIDETALAERPIARVEQALQGQMAGVSVRSTSGSPGADITINVRGAASITGESTPLYVVDGVPLDNLSGINPSDIQSIEVLKDAASAAIYGSRGSNGVILVSTKRGKKGKPVISLSAYTAISNREKKVDVMDSQEWIAFNKKWYDRQWVNRTGQSASVSQAERIAYAEQATGKQYRDRAGLAGIRATYGIYDPYWGSGEIDFIDWQDELFRSAPTNDIQLNAAGATDNISYSISAGVLQQEGIVVGSSFDRYSLRANVDAKMTDRIRLGVNLAPSYGLKKGTNVDGKDAAVSRALSYPGIVLAGAGRMAGADPYKFYSDWGPGSSQVSPYVQAKYNDKRTEDVRINSSMNLTVDIIDGLSVNGLVSWNYVSNMWRSYTPTWIQGTWDTSTPGERSSSRKESAITHNLLGQAMVNYDKEFGDHAISAMAALSEEKNTTETSEQGQSNFANDKTWIFDKDSGKTTTHNSIGYRQNAIISYFGRVQYGYKDRYLLTGSLRRDGSSKFGSKKRWGWFPSISAAWKANEESFLKKFDWLGTAKLRTSWGLAGNDRISNSAFWSEMASGYYPLGDGQDINNGFVVGNIANSRLGWEQTKSINIGLDLGFFNNRIYMQADYYFKKTSDLLLKAPTSLTTGYTSMMDNIGNVENQGFEFELNTVNLKGKFQWNSSLNISLNRNKITKLGSNDGDIRSGQGNTIIQRVGSSINSYYLLKAEGVLRASDFEADGKTPKAGVSIFAGQKAGDTKYYDANKDGKITAEDYIVAGSYQPDFEWGFTNTFRYGNFDMSVLLQGRVGGDLLSIGSRGWNRATNDPRWNYMDQWLHKAYWSEEEPGNGKVPAFFSAVTSQYDTNWMYDAGYIRIKNITLGYDIPVKKSILAAARVYVSCDNVYMWDNYYPGFSPEAATQDNASSDWGSYPLARTFSLGVNITF